MPSRQEVYAAIDTERAYQESFIETDPARLDDSLPPHSVGDYIVMLTTYVREAQEAWTRNGGVSASLHSIRKIAGIAVYCLEDHGAPERVLPR